MKTLLEVTGQVGRQVRKRIKKKQVHDQKVNAFQLSNLQLMEEQKKCAPSGWSGWSGHLCEDRGGGGEEMGSARLWELIVYLKLLDSPEVNGGGEGGGTVLACK